MARWSRGKSVIAQEKEEWDKIAKDMVSHEADSQEGYLASQHRLMKERLLIALSSLGDVYGKKVLVCGCGKGIETIQLLIRGANVSTFDLSDGMCQLTQHRVRSAVPQADLCLVQSAFERLPFPSNQFDLAFGVDILHHLEHIEAGSIELLRVLRPSGKCVFAETWSGNPILMFGRKHIAGHFGIPCWGSTNEHPLDGSQIAALGRGWQEIRLHFPIVMLFFKVFNNPVMGIILRRGRRGDAVERFLQRVFESAQSVDIWFSTWLPQCLRSRLSYVCQIELTASLNPE